MPGCYIAAPSDNIAPSATPSWAVGSENGSFPLANVLTLDPGEVAKANEGTATLRLTFGAAQALVGFALINTNLGGVSVTLSNNGGMANQIKAVPDTEDGLMQNIWWDLTGVASASATQWNVVVSGAAEDVAIGTVLAISAWTEPRVKWRYQIRERYPVISHRTSLQKRIVYNIPVRFRFFEGIVEWAEDRNILRSLRREAGSVTPFVLVPDEEDTDVFLVQFTEDDARETYEFHAGSFSASTATGIVEQAIEVEEVNAGVAL